MSDKKVIIFMQSYSCMNTKLLLDNSTKKFPNIEIIPLPNEEKIDVSAYDLIGFASGIYYWDFGNEVYKHIEKIKGLEGKNVFVLYTAGSVKEGHSLKPKDAIEKKGGKLVAGFGCSGSSKRGVGGFFNGLFGVKERPDENDFKECETFIDNTMKGDFKFVHFE